MSVSSPPGAAPDDAVELSIVTPVHDEAAALPELVRRIVAAAGTTRRSFEVLVVDDASTDDTPAVMARLAHGPVRVLRLPVNRGQFGATQAGLAAARGRAVIVLDGDLQDPPEIIPRLVAEAARAGDAVDAVLAVKSRRDDAAWFLAGLAIFRTLVAILARSTLPAGAGSYCLLRRPLADRVAALAVRTANLAAAIDALKARVSGIPYEKQARYDWSSRVGPLGLVAEGLGSLAITGALHRALFAGAGSLVLVATALACAGAARPAAAALVLSMLLAGVALRLRSQQRQLIR